MTATRGSSPVSFTTGRGRIRASARATAGYARGVQTSAAIDVQKTTSTPTTHVLQELAVPAHGDRPVNLGLDVRPPAGAHAREIELAIVGVADRGSEEFRTGRRDDDP